MNLHILLFFRYTQRGQVWSLYGRLSHDLFSITTVLPVGTKLAFRLHRLRDEMYLCVDDTLRQHMDKQYRVELLKVQCECLRFRLPPPTISILEGITARQAAAYYFPRLESRVYYVPPNSMSHCGQNLFAGLAPSRLFIGFMKTGNYQGAYNRNTLSFEPHNLSSITLRIDNRIHNKTLHPNWTVESGYLDTYIEFLKSNRILNTPAVRKT